MTRDAIYASLLRLYPKSFREQYEASMMHTFSELSRDHQGTTFHFWRVIIGDLWRSLVREHADAWSGRLRRRTLQWVAMCTLGTCASGIAVLLFMGAVALVRPPYVADHVLHNRPEDLPKWMFGAVIGLAFGAAQAFALKHTLRRPTSWIFGTAFAGAVGIYLASLVSQLVLAAAPRPVAIVFGIMTVGAVVGLMQACALRSWQAVARLMFWNALAVAAGVLTCFGVTLLALGSHGPRNLAQTAIVFALMPMIAGAVIGLLTAGATRRSVPSEAID